jgi:purine-binding chemotaxis protein CheW
LLLFRSGGRLCALRLESVRETTRPLPIEPIAGTPPFVLGISVMRGVVNARG